MYRIALVNMPFAGLHMPSLALTQLKCVVDAAFEGRVATEVFYLNQAFARAVGFDLAETITERFESQNAGLGDWYFRQAAFPEAADNSEAYFRRFFPLRTPSTEALKNRVLETRRGVPAMLDRMIDEHALDQADLVGFTSMFSQNAACFALARRLKERNPRIVTVMGGANCEPPMGQEIVRNVPAIDFVFSGPALKSFPEFVGRCLEPAGDRRASLRGVFSRDDGVLPVANAAYALGEELDIDVPIPLDFGAFLATFERNFGSRGRKPALLFETSRGCWWGERAHCTFCGLNGTTMNYRAMSADNALRQFASLFRHAPQVEQIESVDNILPRNYLTDVLPRLQTPPGMRIFYEVKADLGEDELRTLAAARVKHIQPGIEALATSTLKLMKKGTTAFQNIGLLKGCASYGIAPAWNLLIGFPGEDEAVYRKYTADLPLLVHLPPPNGVFPVRFDRYSPYFVQAKAYGLDLHPADHYAFVYPFAPDVLRNLAYHFADRTPAPAYSVLVSKWIAKLRKAVLIWQSAWLQPGREAPRLFVKRDGQAPRVHDTRSGQMVEHALGAHGARVLEHLTKPKRLSDLASEWDGPTGFDPAREVAALQERGLVFQEGARYLSLVLPREPEGLPGTH